MSKFKIGDIIRAKKGVIQLPPMVKVENKQSLSSNKLTNVFEFTGEQGKRDCEVMFAELNLDMSKFAHIYTDNIGSVQIGKNTLSLIFWTEKGVSIQPQIEDGIKSANEIVFAEFEIDALSFEHIYLDTTKQSNLGSNKEIKA